jgi:hypothetical protein
LLYHDRGFQPAAPGIDEKRPPAIGRRQGKPESCDAEQNSRNGANQIT